MKNTRKLVRAKYVSEYHPKFFKDLDKLDKKWFIAVDKKLKEIKENPLRFKHLRGGGNLYSTRVGKYRIIYTLSSNVIWFLICDHRKFVYTVYLQRLYDVKEKLSNK